MMRTVGQTQVEWSRDTAAGFILQFDFKSGPGTVSEGELKYRKYFTVNKHNCRIEAKLTITFVSLVVLLVGNFPANLLISLSMCVVEELNDIETLDETEAVNTSDTSEGGIQD